MHAKSPKPLDYCADLTPVTPHCPRASPALAPRARGIVSRYFPFWPITNFARSSISSGVSLPRNFGILFRSPNSSGCPASAITAATHFCVPRPFRLGPSFSPSPSKSWQVSQSLGDSRSRPRPARDGVDVGRARLGVDVFDQRVHLLGHDGDRLHPLLDLGRAHVQRPVGIGEEAADPGARVVALEVGALLAARAGQAVAAGAAVVPDLARAVHRIVAEHVAVGGHPLEREAARGLAARLLVGARLGVGGIARVLRERGHRQRASAPPGPARRRPAPAADREGGSSARDRGTAARTPAP